nr:CDP-glycerol glycerophosphotransferase family protein [Microbacterium pseudoresistens]
MLRAPLYAAGRVANAVIPRGERWVFGCGAGIGDGALALYALARDEGHDVLWLTASADEARASFGDIRTVPKDSIRGWWATARAGVVVVTHGLGDVNRYASSGALLVQLWHGIPLKRIGLDSPATVQAPILAGFAPMQRLLGFLYRRAQSAIRLLPAASDRSRGRLESAFGLGVEQVLVTGEPRVDVLSQGDPATRRAQAVERRDVAVGPLPEGARAVLYAPTWRDGAPDPAIPSAAEWERIEAVLDEQNAVLLVRSHPLGEGEYRPPSGSERVRLIGASVFTDITPVLPAVDVLITDYSSLLYDVGLLEMPVVPLAPDVEEYARTRGFYGRYEDVAGTDFARDWTTAAAHLRDVLADPAVFAARSRRSGNLSAQMHAHRDGRNTRRVYDAILRRGAPAPKGRA